MNIDKLEKSIFQYTIEGKLVRQNIDQTDSSKNIKYTNRLLNLKNSKLTFIIKKNNSFFEIKQKNESCIDESIPFLIPDNWEWTRLENIANIFVGNSINTTIKNSKYTNIDIGFDYIATKDIDTNCQIVYNTGIKIPISEKGFKIAKKNSVLLCIEGGSAGKKFGMLKKDVCFGNKLVCIDSNNITLNKYLYCVIRSNYFSETFIKNMSGIIGGVSINKIRQILIPLPPMEEQSRIISKIEKIECCIEEYKKCRKEYDLLLE